MRSQATGRPRLQRHLAAGAGLLTPGPAHTARRLLSPRGGSLRGWRPRALARRGDTWPNVARGMLLRGLRSMLGRWRRAGPGGTASAAHGPCARALTRQREPRGGEADGSGRRSGSLSRPPGPPPQHPHSPADPQGQARTRESKGTPGFSPAGGWRPNPLPCGSRASRLLQRRGDPTQHTPAAPAETASRSPATSVSC